MGNYKSGGTRQAGNPYFDITNKSNIKFIVLDKVGTMGATAALSLETAGTSTDYQVPTGKEFVLLAFQTSVDDVIIISNDTADAYADIEVIAYARELELTHPQYGSGIPAIAADFINGRRMTSGSVSVRIQAYGVEYDA